MITRFPFPTAALLVLSLTASASAQATATPDLTRAAQQLSSDRFVVRQQATETLWQAGEAARPVLERVAKTGDREAARRAQTVLKRFNYGLYAETPAEDRRLINMFRFGDLKDKTAVLSQLRTVERVDLVLRLIKAEPNLDTRRSLSEFVFRSLDEFAASLPVDSLDQWEELVRLGASQDISKRHYAVLLHWAGKIDDKLPQLQDSWRKTRNPDDIRLIAYLHRIKGDLRSAQRAAREGEQPEMERALAYEAGAWRDFAALLSKPITPTVGRQDDIETLGFLAAAQRRAGLDEDYFETMTAILAFAQAQPKKVKYAAEALIINDYAEDGIVLMGEYRKDWAFRLYVQQGRYDRAFTIVGLKPDLSNLDAWYERALRVSVGDVNDPQRNFEIALQLTRALHRLGKRSEADKRFRGLAAAAAKSGKQRDSRLRSVIDTVHRLGRRDLSFELAEPLLVGSLVDEPLRLLFPDDSDHAVVLWRALVTLPPPARLKRIRQLVLPMHSEILNAEALRKFAEPVAAAAREMPKKPRIAWLTTLCELCVKHKQQRMGVRFLEEIASLSPDARHRVGEIYLELKDYAKASAAFEKAWSQNRKSAKSLYLFGHCEVQRGNKDKGRKLIRKATLIPLANTIRRRELGLALKQNGLTEEANQQWRLILHSDAFNSWYLNDAAKELGNALSGKDHLETARRWEQLLFSSLKQTSSFIRVEGYSQLVYLVHKSRARGLLEAGNLTEAYREMDLALAALPGDVSLAEDLLPLFDAKGMKAEADLFFNRVYKFNLALCQKYPESALHLNNLAWMSARCNRRLKESLKLSLEAVRLQPKNAAYLDTLAEVYYRLGDKPRALELIQQCLEIEPQNDHFQKQQKRFQAGKE